MKRTRSETTAVALAIALAAAGCGTDMAGSGGRGGNRSGTWMGSPTAGTTGTTVNPGTDPGASTAGGFAADNPGGSPLITPMVAMGAGGSGLKEGQCAKGDVNFTRIVPTVWLVLDGSGSMLTALGEKTRWEALREALMDPTLGVVKTLEKDIKFGMIMYDGPGTGGMGTLPDGGVVTFSSGQAMTCPRLVSVEPQKMAFDAINAVYPPDPLGGSTPTDRALEAVIQHLPVAGSIPPDQIISPTVVVLATDGEPNDFCSMSFPPIDVRPKVIQAVGNLAAAGNKTYVISLAGMDANLTQHLTQVAAAGMTGKPPFIPDSKDELVQIFRDIIGPAASCDIRLNGKVTMGSECKGKLQLNGVDLGCNDPDGWSLKDPQTLSITGKGCETLKMQPSATLHADFPCDIFDLN